MVSAIELQARHDAAGLSTEERISATLRHLQAVIVESGLSDERMGPREVREETCLALGRQVNDTLCYLADLQCRLIGIPPVEPLPPKRVRPELRLVPPVAEVVERIAAQYRPSSMPPAGGAL